MTIVFDDVGVLGQLARRKAVFAYVTYDDAFRVNSEYSFPSHPQKLLWTRSCCPIIFQLSSPRWETASPSPMSKTRCWASGSAAVELTPPVLGGCRALACA